MADKHINDELKDIKKVKLSDVATIKTSKRVLTSDYKSTGIPFLKGSDLSWVENKASLDFDINYITNQKFDELREKSGFPQQGDILVTGNGTIGKTFLVSTKDEFYFKDGVLWLTDITCNKEFLYMYIRENVLGYVEKLSHGSTITNLNIETLRSLPIPQLDIVEQEKIAKLLSSIEDLIQQSIDLENLYVLQKKNCMQKLFSDDLEKIKIKDMIEYIVDNRGKTPPTCESGIPLIEVNSLGEKDINYSKVSKYISEEEYENFLRKYLIKGDICISTVGNTCQSSIYNSEVKAAIAQNIIAFRVIKEIDINYFYYVITYAKNINYLKSIQMNGVQPSIKVTQLIDLHLPMHKEYTMQQKIGNLLYSIDELIIAERKQRGQYKLMKKYYLNLIFK